MSLAADLVAQIRAALATVARARRGTAAVRDLAVEIHAEITVATDGSGDERPAEARLRLEYAQIKLDEATAEFDAATAAAEAYIAAVGGTGGEVAGPPVPGAPSQPVAQPIPAAVRRLADQLPVWRRGRKTRALAFLDEDGAEVEFSSGGDPTAADGLHPRFAARLVTTDHAEGHLAARLRQPGAPRAVTAVINKTPCVGPEGCDATLPAIIPRDVRVTVYVGDANGVGHYKTYHGTGEGIL